MHGPNGMMESGMQSTRINERGQSELLDTSQPLKPGMVNHCQNQGVIDGDEPIQRVIDDFIFYCRSLHFAKVFKDRTSAAFVYF
jgi:hypothetical protein